MDGTIEAGQLGVVGRDLRPGDSVGPYELLFHAAQGGMATIWAARLKGVRGFQQLVAVKVLLDTLVDEPNAQAMFLDEASTAARIGHPNVAQVLDYGEAHGRPYLAMEWLEGESLARIAAAQRSRGGRLPLRWVLHVAAAACAGLHAAHEARDDDGELMHLVHRDVSPQNVMVTFDGITKVVDFGVAKSRRRTQVTRVGVIKGKTGYFSPEQIRAAEVDRRSDLFSFGIVLYLLTTDHHPFRGRSAFETVQNIATKVARAPRDFVPDMPLALNRLILRALAPEPAARFQTAAELQRALEQVSVALGGRLTDKEVGATARNLLPGVADVRRTRLACAAARLDATCGDDAPPSEPTVPNDARPLLTSSRSSDDETWTSPVGLAANATTIPTEGAARAPRAWREEVTERSRAHAAPAAHAAIVEQRPTRGGPMSTTPQGMTLSSSPTLPAQRRPWAAPLAATAALALVALAVHGSHAVTPAYGAPEAARNLPRWVLRPGPPRPPSGEVTPAQSATLSPLQDPPPASRAPARGSRAHGWPTSFTRRAVAPVLTRPRILSRPPSPAVPSSPALTKTPPRKIYNPDTL